MSDKMEQLEAARNVFGSPIKKQTTNFSWIRCFCVVGFNLDLGPVLEHVHPDTHFTPEERKTIIFAGFPEQSTQNTEMVFSFKVYGDVVYNAHVYFKQCPDTNLKRGYYQKSIVLLSQHSFPDLWTHVIKTLGPIACETGIAALESTASQISKWQSPHDGQVDLPLFGNLVLYTIPGSTRKNIHDFTTIYPIFEDFLDRLWVLWELVLLEQPIAVLASSPATCSAAVEGLTSLVLPLQVSVDVWPYFTIQDPNFSTVTQKMKGIVGASNPHLHSIFNSWPNVVCFGKKNLFSEKLITKHKRTIGRDGNFLAEISALVILKKSKTSIDEKLSLHFFDLTTKFLAPIKEYIDSLFPLVSLDSDFSQQVFLQSKCLDFITKKQPLIPLKTPVSSYQNLYKRFFETKMFLSFLKKNLKNNEKQWQNDVFLLYCSSDLTEWVTNKSIDSISALLCRMRNLRDMIPNFEAKILNQQIKLLEKFIS